MSILVLLYLPVETAAVLEISESTVRREERVAKAWLRKRLSEGQEEAS